MKNFPIVSRALLTASSKAHYPTTEILWHLKAAYHFGDTLSEQTLRGHLDQARQHAQAVLEAINDVQLEVDRACRGNGAEVIAISVFEEQQSGVHREMAAPITGKTMADQALRDIIAFQRA